MLFDKQNISVPTGLTAAETSNEVGITVDNKFIDTEMQARDAALRTVIKYAIPAQTYSFEGPNLGDFLTTPMQVAQFTALMATGKLPRPYFANMLGEKIIEPELQEVLDESELKKLPTIQKAMYEVCNVAGGTGTNYLKTKVKIEYIGFNSHNN